MLRGNPNLMIRSVHFDTRQLQAESLFVAVKGTRDGHAFLPQAAANGAVAALISEPEQIPADLPETFALILVNDTVRAYQKLGAAYRRQFAFPFIAVTGSNGKTTTKDMIAHLLAQKMPLYRTYKNYNNHLGVPYSLLQLEQAHQAAVLELGMNHAGEIDQLAALVRPQISVITYIGDAHLEYFGSRKKIALAKAELLPHTDPDGLVLLNGDNPYLRQIAHLYEGTVHFYSIEGKADIWAEGITSDDRGTRFTVCFADGTRFACVIPLFGRHNVLNCLPAIAIARRFGMTVAEIVAALATIQLSAMRFEVAHSERGAVLINDAYNASPSSMEAAIATFAEIFPGRKKVLVLGDMFELGSDSPQLHAGVGEFANQYRDHFDQLIAIGHDARHLHDAYQGDKRHFPAKEEAVSALRELDTAEHAVLLKASRGMKFETLLEAFSLPIR